MECIEFKELEGAVLYEQTDYAVVIEDIDDVIKDAGLERYSGIFKRVGEKAGILNFGNFIGEAEFLGRSIRVVSRKVTEDEVSRMLVDITRKMAALPFDFNTPAFSSFEIDDMASSEVFYHTYLILRQIMLGGEADLKSAYETVFGLPNMCPERENTLADIWDVRDMSENTIRSIVSRPENLYKLNDDNPLKDTALAGAIHKRCGKYYFPRKAESRRVVRSFDTLENRFLKYFLNLIDDMLGHFMRLVEQEKPLNRHELSRDIEMMKEITGELLMEPLFDDVSEMSVIPYNSMLLQRGSGYREVFMFYNMLQNSIRLPFSNDQLKLFIENKDLAEIYELWTYFKMMDLVEEILGTSPNEASAVYDDFREYIKFGICAKFISSKGSATLYYNKTYSRGSKSSYSVTLRPDIVLEFNGGTYIFDAKFKIRSIDLSNAGDAHEGDKSYTFKNEDIYKMHTYRDAIKGTKVACILYPNTDEAISYFEDNERDGGVGAIPLLPSGSMDGVRKFLQERCFGF